MIHQLCYRFQDPPTATAIEIARQNWLAGKPTTGVTIHPIHWARDERSTKAAAVNGYIGHAGIVKCYGRPDWTLCDYDQKKPPSLYQLWRVAQMLGLGPWNWVRMDRTRRGWHVIIEWRRKFKPLEIVAIQFALGSDQKRETFNAARVFSGKGRNRRWNMLFEKKLT